MKAVIIAAGRGSRLAHHTDERPKCMVRVAGRSILDHQLAALHENGVDDIHIVRGYLAEQLLVDGATYWANDTWEQNNILHSLFCAAEALEGPLLTTYSDIVYGAEVVKKAMEMPGHINLVVDRRWQQAYKGRTDHPVEQAELTEVDGPLVRRVGKQVGPERALGEFIGLASYTAEGARIMRSTFEDLRARLDDDDEFRNGRIFRRAYLADFFEELIARDHPVHWVAIDGGWREIDTVEDLEAVNTAWSSGVVVL